MSNAAAMNVSDLDAVAADLAPAVVECFASHAKDVRLYLAGCAVIGADTLDAARKMVGAAVAGDRKARRSVVDSAAYWLSRWDRFGAVA